MSNKNFAAYDEHMIRREVLGQHKSVLLKNAIVLELVCTELDIEGSYPELLEAGQMGHIILRSRFFLCSKELPFQDGFIAIIDKSSFEVMQLTGRRHRVPDAKEIKQLEQVITSVFSPQLLI